MKNYVVWIDETDTYKMFFQAENIEQAKELLAKVVSGEIDTTDLPEMDKVGKNYELGVAMETLQELGDN